jgi:spore maturation protein CgeB
MIEERLRFRIHFQSEERESYFLKTLEKAATILYRKSLLSCLSNSELHLYGDYGWMEFDEEKFAGFIDSHEEMARLYNLVKVNLNITETQFKTTLSPSIFNILACKGFALTDYRMDLEEFFDLGKELVCFRDENDLREKIKYYIRNPDEREEIGRRGLEKVLASHTYKNRIERMIKCIEG